MLRRRKQMNGIYPGLLHCFAVRNDAVRLITAAVTSEGEA